MARLPVNLRDVDVLAFPIYPPGLYTLRVDETRQEAARSSGELKLTATFEILDGPNGSPEFAGKKILTSYSLQPQALFRLKKLIIACGISDEQIPTDGLDDQMLVGCVIQAQVAVEKYQGKDVNRVTNEAPSSGNAVGIPTGVAPAPMAPAPTGFVAPTNGPQATQPPVPVPPGWTWDPVKGTFAPAVAGPVAPAPPPAKPAPKAAPKTK
jgi:hypothetical protein